MQRLLLILLSVLFIASRIGPKESVPQLIEDGKYKLVWSDEFNKDGKPDSTHWSYERGFVRNQELQWYQKENAYCKDGLLILEGRKERIENDQYDSLSKKWKQQRKYGEYTAASILTKGKFTFQFGMMLVRAKIDTAMGLWPAIWTLGAERPWPSNGEVDLMEFYRWNNQATILANAAWLNSEGKAQWDGSKTPLKHFTEKRPDWADQFHIWKMKWTTTSIELFLDDELLNQVDLTKTINPDGFNPFHQQHFILLNLAIGQNGGDPSTTSFPRQYQIDYVRIYQEVK